LCTLVCLSCDTFTGASPNDAGSDAPAVDGAPQEAGVPDAATVCEPEPLWSNQPGGPTQATCSTGLQDLRTTPEHCGRCERACGGKSPSCVAGYCVVPKVVDADIPLAVDDTTLWYGDSASGNVSRVGWRDGSGTQTVTDPSSGPVLAGHRLAQYVFVRTERGLFRFDTTAPPSSFGASLISGLDNGMRRRVAALEASTVYALDSGGHIVGSSATAPAGVRDAWELAASGSRLFWAPAAWRAPTTPTERGVSITVWDSLSNARHIEHTSTIGAIHSLGADAEYIYWMDVDPDSQGVFRHRIGSDAGALEKVATTRHVSDVQGYVAYDLRQQMLLLDETYAYYWELATVDTFSQPHFRLSKVKKCGGNAVPLVEDCANLGRWTIGAKVIAYACNREIRVVAK